MPEREPTSTLEDLEIEVDGTIQRGQRVVLTVSNTEVRQEIRYGSLRRVDPEVYTAAHSAFMLAIAREILWRLVAESKAAGGTRRPVTLEPRPRRHRRRPSES